MEKLYEQLKKDPLSYADILEILRRKSGEIIYSDEFGFMIFDKKSEIYFSSAKTKQAAQNLLEYVENLSIISVHEDFYSDLIEEKFGLKPVIICNQAIYEKKEKIEFCQEFEIRLLDESHIGIIHQNYKSVDDIEYIKGRVKDGMYGAFENGVLAGFIGMHAEGSIGLLQVFESFRRRNIGYYLSAFMINKCLEEGIIPFSQIGIGNKASFGLHEKLGFRISDKRIYWLERV